MNQPNRKAMIVISLFVVGIMVLAVGMSFFSDGHKLWEAVHHIHAEQLLFALLCTGIAYLAFTLSFNGLFEMTPYRVPFNRFFSIMFISYTINFIVSTGGWAGIAIRSYLLRFEKVPYSVTVPISFAQNMVFNLVLSGACFGGLIYLREHPEFIGGGREGIVFGFMVGLVVVVATMLLIFFHAGFRKWFLRLMIKMGSWLGRVFLRKQSSHQRLVEIRNSLEETIQFLHRGWLQLLVVFFWVCMDWGFTALALFFCFRAVDIPMHLGLLLVGFAVMNLTSNFNPVPAGLGISEVFLAGTFKLLGVEYEKALVAALLFRFVFFLLPMAVSTALYLDTMRGFLKAEDKIEEDIKKQREHPNHPRRD